MPSTLIDAVVSMGVQGPPGPTMPAMRLATVAALPAHTVVSTGLLANAVGALTIDGVAALAGDYVLVKSEGGGTSVYNRIYQVTAPGDGATFWRLSYYRGIEYRVGTAVCVGLGSNAITIWALTTDSVIIPGTTAMTWEQVSGGGGGGLSTVATISPILGDGSIGDPISLDLLTDADIAITNIDGGANVPSMRTLGTGPFQAMPGDTVVGGTGLQPANNLSDVASAATSRTNLGLGTAATQASGAFDAAGAATTAQAAAIASANATSATGDALSVHLAGTETVTGDKTFSGVVTLTGAVRYKRTATAVSYSMVAGDVIIGVTSTASARTVTLLGAQPAGTAVTVQDESGAAGTNAITVAAASGSVLGLSVISTNYGRIALYSTGSDWIGA